MKPNEHIKLPDDELIAHIKGQLMAHEEDYAPGAWENFNADKSAKKRGMFFWLGSLSTAAALVLIGFAIFFVNNKKEGLKPSILTGTSASNQTIKLPVEVKEKALKAEELIKEVKPAELASTPEPANANLIGAGKSGNPVGVLGDLAQVSGSKSRNQIPAGHTTATSTQVHQPSNVQETTFNHSVIANSTSNTVHPSTTVAVTQQRQEAVLKDAAAEVKTQSLEEFLAQESKNGNARGRKNQAKVARLPMEDKWEMGVMVAPSVGSSKKLNMGYGLSMGYALSKRVSINSGISYNEMGASRTASPASDGAYSSPATTTMGLASNSKELKAVDANIRGIDIPLEIRYRLTNSLYANVGISAFAVLNQKQKNTFLESQVQSSLADPGSTASATFKANVLSTTVIEERKNSELKTDPYLGFYNFSLGYKQQISRGKSVSLEPFVKLPIKEFTQENLYLIGTGLRLKFDF
ncbi:hypothetical protein [Pedobacter gandavensis]|uniref:Outer membrane protein beta-barrel domain-containing protein n=1 Tax=Pedobacter gandavensis TaxID=2679963 RepID=A0ABR6EZ63_9SPHI|nr:hypothetical protein [Pedobacter gandavensis]MBB2150119.1 hypothetical protein [Pedobacter gandavensis]